MKSVRLCCSGEFINAFTPSQKGSFYVLERIGSSCINGFVSILALPNRLTDLRFAVTAWRTGLTSLTVVIGFTFHFNHGYGVIYGSMLTK